MAEGDETPPRRDLQGERFGGSRKTSLLRLEGGEGNLGGFGTRREVPTKELSGRENQVRG